MSPETQRIMIEEIAGLIDIPESAYEKAEKRYAILGEWFKRQDSKCFPYAPHIYPQGSFRLGTVIKPSNAKEEYDLDVGCRLQHGISKTSHTQKQLKEFVRLDLEEYRKANKIQNPLDEKQRCWRLQYADEMSFHMDVVPSIPEEAVRIQSLQEAMVKNGRDKFLAESVAKLAGSITDNTQWNYGLINPDWRISNSEGYAKWFESRMKLGRAFLERRIYEAKVAKVDDLPARKWKSPLQRSIQILKHHRDHMFKNREGKPISVIITTLAANAYQGEDTVETAMRTILSKMEGLVRVQSPRVPNPVNPSEDFADKWATPEGVRLGLENNFREWVRKARQDFDVFASSKDVQYLSEQAVQRFGTVLNTVELQKKINPSVSVSMASKGSQFPHVAISPTKPWSDDGR